MTTTDLIAVSWLASFGPGALATSPVDPCQSCHDHEAARDGLCDACAADPFLAECERCHVIRVLDTGMLCSDCLVGDAQGKLTLILAGELEGN